MYLFTTEEERDDRSVSQQRFSHLFFFSRQRPSLAIRRGGVYYFILINIQHCMCNCKNVSLFYYPYNIPRIGSYKKEMVQEAGFEPTIFHL